MLRLFGRDDDSLFAPEDERLLVRQDMSPQIQRELNDLNYARRDNNYRLRYSGRNVDEAAQSLICYEENNERDEERFDESPSTSNYSFVVNPSEERIVPPPAPHFQPFGFTQQRDLYRNQNTFSVSLAFSISRHTTGSL
jgi:hypothetical protein